MNKDLRIWKETYVCGKETYIYEKRTTCMNWVQFIWIGLNSITSFFFHICRSLCRIRGSLFIRIESYSYERRPGAVVGNSDKEPFTNVKRDLHIWKETYLHDKWPRRKRDQRIWKRDLEQWLETVMGGVLQTSKETYIYEKRPTYMTNLEQWLETVIRGVFRPRLPIRSGRHSQTSTRKQIHYAKCLQGWLLRIFTDEIYRTFSKVISPPISLCKTAVKLTFENFYQSTACDPGSPPCWARTKKAFF